MVVPAGGGTKGIMVTLPGNLTAYNKGYRYYILYHAGPYSSMPPYEAFSYRAAITLNADGSQKTYTDGGAAVTVPPNAFSQATEPPGVLEWDEAGIGISKINLNARYVGTYMTASMYGETGDPLLNIMQIGFDFFDKKAI